ncbi:hypothetical protein JB92DRAFT_3107039 [Gautieria morchelliformis]|nr:hypothetical protein JB92DRAFT_3107039 [Gautieria morchelliformis]
MSPNFSTHTLSRHMHSTEEAFTLGVYYQYLYKLTEAANYAAPHPGDAPDGFVGCSVISGFSEMHVPGEGVPQVAAVNLSFPRTSSVGIVVRSRYYTQENTSKALSVRAVIEDSFIFEPQQESTPAGRGPRSLRKSANGSQPENTPKALSGRAVIEDSFIFEPQRESTPAWRGPRSLRKSANGLEPENTKPLPGRAALEDSLVFAPQPKSTMRNMYYGRSCQLFRSIMYTDILLQQEKKGDAAIFDPRFVGYCPPFNREDIQAQSSFRNLGDLARGLS